MKSLNINELVVRRELLLRDIAELEPYINGKGRCYWEVQRHIGLMRRERYLLSQQIREAKNY